MGSTRRWSELIDKRRSGRIDQLVRGISDQEQETQPIQLRGWTKNNFLYCKGYIFAHGHEQKGLDSNRWKRKTRTDYKQQRSGLEYETNTQGVDHGRIHGQQENSLFLYSHELQLLSVWLSTGGVYMGCTCYMQRTKCALFVDAS